MIRVFSCLQRHPHSGILYFRYVVPERLRRFISLTEIKRSLRTSDKRIAIPRGMLLYIEIQQLLERVAKDTPMQKPKRQKKPDDGFISKIVFDEIEMPGGRKAKGVVIEVVK